MTPGKTFQAPIHRHGALVLGKIPGAPREWRIRLADATVGDSRRVAAGRNRAEAGPGRPFSQMVFVKERAWAVP
jgi:hypothetical protein